MRLVLFHVTDYVFVVDVLLFFVFSCFSSAVFALLFTVSSCMGYTFMLWSSWTHWLRQGSVVVSVFGSQLFWLSSPAVLDGKNVCSTMWLQFYHVCRKENVWRLCQLTVEGDTHVGRAVAAEVAPNTRSWANYTEVGVQ